MLKSRHLLSSFVQWVIIIATLVVVGVALGDHWREVQRLELDKETWWYIIVSLAVSLIAHCWSGVLWGEIFRNFYYRVPWRWAIVVFIKTEIAKYLPGNVVQTYGRLRAAQKIGIPIIVGIVSILLQSVYIAAAGMAFGLLNPSDKTLKGLCAFGLISILICVHPFVFNRLSGALRQLSKKLGIQKLFANLTRRYPQHLPPLQYYPFPVILGQMLFLALRSVSFIFAVAIFTPVVPSAFLPLAAGFGLAWALGIVSPISGGVGVFEATALGLLDRIVEPSVVLGAVVVYRLISLLTEAIGWGIGWLIDRPLKHSA